VQEELLDLCFLNETIVKDMYRPFLGSSFQSSQKKKDPMVVFSTLLPTLHIYVSIQALSDVFWERIISSGTWPARSPDLNPCDFLFWGCFFKDKVYNSNPRTEELKGNVHRELSNIPAEQLQRVNQNLFCRCEGCLRVEGQHFQHLL
jgi:hypothetical protein